MTIKRQRGHCKRAAISQLSCAYLLGGVFSPILYDAILQIHRCHPSYICVDLIKGKDDLCDCCIEAALYLPVGQLAFGRFEKAGLLAAQASQCFVNHELRGVCVDNTHCLQMQSLLRRALFSNPLKLWSLRWNTLEH